MAITFANAPLVELIAEFKWTPSDTLSSPAGPQGIPQVVPFLGGTKLEEFLMRLGGELYQLSFQKSERLVPPGFPALPNQAVVRFRSNDAPKSSVLYQAGSGMLSVHATPPYRTWKEFLPHVESGLKILLKSRNDSEKDQPFSEVNLRYIDLFGEELTQGRSVASFISEVLGISVSLPEVVRTLNQSGEISSLNMLFVLPTLHGNLTVNVADGKAGNRSGVVLITSLTSKSPRPANHDAIMKTLSDAHSTIHGIFMDMTKPIHDLMKPNPEVIQ